MILTLSRLFMNKTLCASQNAKAQTIPADVFGRLWKHSLAALHSAECRFVSGVE